MMKNFLITAANSDISIGLARILRLSFPDALLVGVAPDGTDPSAHFFDMVLDVPLVDHSVEYKKSIEQIIKDNHISVLFPISEKELKYFSDSSYKPLDKIAINPKPVLEKTLDKLSTYSWLKSIGVPVPETQLLSASYPDSFRGCIIKPRSSAGSKNMYSVNNKILYDAIASTYMKKQDDFVVQRSISTSDDEYTCALWRYNEDYRSIVLRRKLQGGLTGEAEIQSTSQIDKVLKSISDNIQGNFFINVQLRVEDDIPFVFEINPRFSSTIMMRHKVGFQDVLWTTLALLNDETPAYLPPIQHTKIFRIADELVMNENKEAI